MTDKNSADIITANFILEPIQVRHARILYPLMLDNTLYRYIPINAPASIEALENKYQAWSKGVSDNGDEIWLNYAIRQREGSEYVGTLQATIKRAGPTYIAYETYTPYQRSGVAKESCAALIKHLFENCETQTITAHLDTHNIASKKLLESLQFTFVRTIEKADAFKGRVSDEYVYELSR
jgi:ribosomal-protein-alanine N-acetyltransferase